MSEAFEQTTVGEIVSSDFRAAEVFERFGIDFCCGGRQSVGDACRTAAVDPARIREALQTLPAAGAPQGDEAAWPISQLVDHILTTHHEYLRSSIPMISRHLTKLADVHGERHPELLQVQVLFEEMAADLMQHMVKEERVLFPYIRELGAHTVDPSWPCPFGTVENPIRMMEREHQEAGDQLRMIRELTHGFAVPGDGCATYRVCFAELLHFERDLHRHVHLENNVLFPKAIDVEHRTWRA
jgi:regulator of cell morphogenesis and NO signaling